MVNLSIKLLVVTAVFYTTNGYIWQPGAAKCGCYNPIYIDKPKNIADCYPKTKFLNQIFQNSNNVNFALLLNASPNGCDLTKYRWRVYEMKERTLKMVEAYFSCGETNCTQAIMAAYHKYVDYLTFEFNPYARCAFNNFDRDCAQVLVQNRPPVYGSAENILIALLTCAKFKAEAHSGKVQSLTSVTPVTSNHYEEECNCIILDPRPIPKDECECFSDKYIVTLTSFVEINFDRVFAEYETNSNSTCDYTELIGYTEQLKLLSSTMIKLLEKPSPQFTEFDVYYKEFSDSLSIYNQAVRSYILKNEKPCYFTARKARQNPIAIVETVISALTKCIGYRVLGHDRCSNFL